MERLITCIICPRGCSMKIEGEKGAFTVSGNSCPKGEKYAIDECTHPLRTVTSIVRVDNRENTMVSVKTEKAIPKENIFDAMQMIRDCKIKAPVKIGDIIIKDVFGTCVIATKNID